MAMTIFDSRYKDLRLASLVEAEVLSAIALPNHLPKRNHAVVVRKCVSISKGCMTGKPNCTGPISVLEVGVEKKKTWNPPKKYLAKKRMVFISLYININRNLLQPLLPLWKFWPGRPQPIFTCLGWPAPAAQDRFFTAP